ncbi:hypothetical protein, partial [Spirosoma migulaei]
QSTTCRLGMSLDKPYKLLRINLFRGCHHAVRLVIVNAKGYPVPETSVVLERQYAYKLKPDARINIPNKIPTIAFVKRNGAKSEVKAFTRSFST